MAKAAEREGGLRAADLSGILRRRPAVRTLLERLPAEGEVSLATVPEPLWGMLAAGAGLLGRGPGLVVAPEARTMEFFAGEAEAWGASCLVFPERGAGGGDLAAGGDEEEAAQWQVLQELGGGSKRPVVATVRSLGQPVPEPGAWRASLRTVRAGETHDPQALMAELEEAGYVRETLVAEAGQFTQRGGVVDVFPRQAARPVRLEWFGDMVESLREFDPVSQRSVGELRQVDWLLHPPGEGGATLAAHLPGGAARWVLHGEPGVEVLEAGDGGPVEHDFLGAVPHDPVGWENRRILVRDEVRGWLEEGWEVWLACHNEGEEARLREWLGEGGAGDLHYARLPLARGFAWPAGRWAVLADAEIFSRYQNVRPRRADRMERLRAAGWGEWETFAEGDYVVHREHGVGVYRGLQEAEDGRQMLEIGYSEDMRLLVPLDQAWLVAKYQGAGARRPPLDALRGSRWAKKKKDARAAVLDYAARLLRIQAERQALGGFAFPADHPWQGEFERAFLHEPTADQVRSLAEIKRDMESPRPMDRLLCGDVGFGKTEVALRALFKAVTAGKQGALLAPTTVLAQQHFRTLTERMADYPVRLGMLSRFVPPGEQRAVIRGLAEGGVDLVVGTHRLLSGDVVFKDLGLVVVDEEQRFGVEHKEALKEKFRGVDLLSLSATPIPRTLYLSLLGARDLSTLETPPPNRRPVETQVCAYDERLIRQALERELARGGQVYFLHNRVRTIGGVAKRLEFLVPAARVEVGHGQMHEDELEEVMLRFVEGKSDVLVATTIIESGIDIPNANTIIIDRADRFGLADLYQLRGRVGRRETKAHALLLLPRDLVGGDAGKRVDAIRRYTRLGSGFKVAMRDLEIRGAGNLLGTAQSGHLHAVGFDLYCRLLKEAVAALKGEVLAPSGEVSLRMDFLSIGDREEAGRAKACVPSSWLPETSLRVQAYRELAELGTLQEWEELRRRWRDRLGRWPEEVELLLMLHRVRIAALSGFFTQIDVKAERLMMKRRGDYVMVDGKFPRLKTKSAKDKLKEIEQWMANLAN